LKESVPSVHVHGITASGQEAPGSPAPGHAHAGTCGHGQAVGSRPADRRLGSGEGREAPRPRAERAGARAGGVISPSRAGVCPDRRVQERARVGGAEEGGRSGGDKRGREACRVWRRGRVRARIGG